MPTEPESLVILGMTLSLAGQVVQAAQVVTEEWLLKDVDLPPMQIVGFEGVWGSIVMLLAVFPLLWTTPGSDHGHQEDTLDTFALIESNPSLQSMLGLFMFSCMTYNMAGMAVTNALSAVHRVMIEALRTCIVWGFGLYVHYYVDATSKFGERWTPYSPLAVCGFGCLVLGQATYGGFIRWPCLWYPTASLEPETMASPGGVRNLASPLPPDL